ncbi:unnamed protein product, partial [Pylaiella littoralis]
MLNREVVMSTPQISPYSSTFRRNSQAMYDRPGAPLRLKVRLLQAEVVETLPYGCVTWNLKPAEYR